jgi:adenosylcobinamide-phosphate synthase
MIAAVILDWCLGEPRRCHPLVGFGAIAQHLESALHGRDGMTPALARARGTAATLLAVAPPTALIALLIRVPRIGIALQILALYLVIGRRSLHLHARRVAEALDDNDLPTARHRVAMMVSRDTGAMQRREIARAAVESVLENGNDAVFGALFWFALAGAPGAVFYRLVNTLDAMWGYRTPHYLYFGWAAARLDDLLNLLPARLAALTYALCGHMRLALQCWRKQARLWESPNAGPVMAAGAGSLQVRLGGPAFYHGQWKVRPALGHGAEPEARDIARALRLVSHGILIWLGIAALGALIILIHRRFMSVQPP